jgi:lambda family phage portal protein
MSTANTPDLSPTVVDRIARYVAPEYALRRMRARASLAVFDTFSGASTQRRSMRQWFTSRGSADVDTLPFLARLRTRSRDLVRNNPLACGAISGSVTSIVGTGLVLQSAIDAEFLGLSDDEAQAWQKNTEREFAIFAETPDCDLTRHQDFYGLQDLVCRSTFENGDAVTLLPYKKLPGATYGLRIQLIEADRLCNQDFAADSRQLAGGVAMDDFGAPTGYHILRQHPGDYLQRDGLVWDVVPAFGNKTGRRNVLHHFRRVRVGQTRGLPFLTPVIETIKQLGRYSDAEIMAAVVSGLFTVFVTTEGGVGIPSGVPGLGVAPAAGTPAGQEVILDNGNIIDLKPGETISTAAPGRPNANFDPFFQSCVRQIGVGLEIPFEVLIKHFTASYTAARAALLEAWKFYSGRRAWLIQSFCDPVYEAWMDEAVAAGRIDAPGFFDDPAIRRAYLENRWHGDAMPQVDPVKEVEAARGRVDLGVSDRARETAMLTGGDWETTHKQQVREANMRKADGLDPLPPPLKPINAEDPTQGGDLPDTETPPPPSRPSTPPPRGNE